MYIYIREFEFFSSTTLFLSSVAFLYNQIQPTPVKSLTTRTPKYGLGITEGALRPR